MPLASAECETRRAGFGSGVVAGRTACIRSRIRMQRHSGGGVVDSPDPERSRAMAWINRVRSVFVVFGLGCLGWPVHKGARHIALNARSYRVSLCGRGEINAQLFGIAKKIQNAGG